MSTELRQEVWRDIPGWEGHYQASTFGNIRSLTRTRRDGRIEPGKMMTLRKKKNGYMQTAFRLDRKRFWYTAHRLVALTFIVNDKNAEYVNHINCVKDDNRVENLEWMTIRQNTDHALENDLYCRGEDVSNSKLTAEQAREIKFSKERTGTLVSRFGVERHTISNIRSGKTWKHII